jgi:phosphoribosylglycinamide formyltransferase-1
VSGSGTNLQALLDACHAGEVPAEVAVVISNVPGAFALERARGQGVPALVLDHRAFPSRGAFETALRETLESFQVGLVCLAGFLRILSPGFVALFSGRIMNIHPALLPAFGGRGMYGQKVHQAVLTSGARVSGCTVHFVTALPDAGPIILQSVVAVEDDDTPATLAARVQREERRLYPLAVRLFADDRLRIEGARVRIRPAATSASSAPSAIRRAEGTP